MILFVIIAAAGTAGAIWYFGFQKPYNEAQSTMPADQTVTLEARSNGTFLLKWPKSEEADFYRVEILPPQAETPKFSEQSEAEQDAVVEPLYAVDVEEGESCILPDILENPCMIRIQSVRQYHVIGEDRERLGQECIELSGPFPVPTINNLKWMPDANNQKVDVSFALEENETCELFFAKGEEQERDTRTLTEGKTTYTFGEKGDYPFLSFDQQYQVSCRVYRTLPGLIYYGPETEGFTIIREDLLGTKLTLNCEEKGNNVFALSWNETKGDHYELQMRQKGADNWETLFKVPQGQEHSFTTGHLPRYQTYEFRILALGGQALPGSQYAAEPDQTSVTTVATPVFCTIWPTRELTVYSDTTKSEAIGAVPEATAYCVLDEIEDLFAIRYGDGVGYIDSRYCMINLPEYIGDICAYSITNSYDSLYMVHEFEIPEVTGTVVKGYEQVMLYDGTSLAPLLYPTAKKLEQAAFTALSEGYRLKIYDSYRPREATLSIYNLTSKIIDDEIPEETYTGKPLEELDLPEIEEEEPEEESEEESKTEEESGTENSTPETEEEPEKEVLTYKRIMTDNRYSLGNFLAYGGSYHNMGIAMDLTLEVLDSGWELEMQTSMHDLSWYSEINRNNSNANLLDRIMKSAGFGGLTSEWWHFQDNEARETLKLENFMQAGIGPACWMADDNGWRYRTSDGRYVTDTTTEIDGVTYTFDRQGYIVK